jgi:catalase
MGKVLSGNDASKPALLHRRENPPSAMGNGGELHQTAEGDMPVLTTNQGTGIADDQNSLRVGTRGPTLLEDFILREKITHFDHERIPERVVHARGTGVHGYFELEHSLDAYTTAAILNQVGKRTPVFARFSTVAGGAGSADTPRDARGFAVKFYTDEGNWDLVGNNIPVFFIQDAIKFPDLIHAVKMEPDRGFPQAATAHDTFWDYMSVTPEAMHMVMWIMSDRTLPRSLRMMEGFGIHTFRLVNAQGISTFVKFHWRPMLGLQSTLWDEAVKISGADPDFHRRDMFEAVTSGHPPEWQLAVQLFTEEDAANFSFDHLDPTKLIPEELVPLRPVGRMVLDRWPDNFFAETEQVAFCPSHIVPGIDFSDDPLLQGRLFSYLDTQLTRLGSPNFHQIPVNAPRCPFANHQRDGHMQMTQPHAGVAYEPNTLANESPRESPTNGFSSYAENLEGQKLRIRAADFADHYSQARMFYRSQSIHEQGHIVSALIFELSKVQHQHVREAMVAHLRNIDEDLAQRVFHHVGLATLPEPAATTVDVQDMAPSPALQIIGRMKDTLKGRVIGILAANGSDRAAIDAVRSLASQAAARTMLIAHSIGEIKASDGAMLKVDAQLAGSPSVMLDAVAVFLVDSEAVTLCRESAAVDFLRDAYSHLKAICFDEGAGLLLESANCERDERMFETNSIAEFIDAAKGRCWERESKVRIMP